MKFTFGGHAIDTNKSKVLCDKLLDDSKQAGIRLCASPEGIYFVHVVYGTTNDSSHGGIIKRQIKDSELSEMFGPNISWTTDEAKSNAIAFIEPFMEEGFQKFDFPKLYIDQAMAFSQTSHKKERVSYGSDNDSQLERLSHPHNETLPIRGNKREPSTTTSSRETSWHESLFVRLVIVLGILTFMWMFRYEQTSTWIHKNRITGAVCNITQECWFSE